MPRPSWQSPSSPTPRSSKRGGAGHLQGLAALVPTHQLVAGWHQALHQDEGRGPCVPLQASSPSSPTSKSTRQGRAHQAHVHHAEVMHPPHPGKHRPVPRPASLSHLPLHHMHSPADGPVRRQHVQQAARPLDYHVASTQAHAKDSRGRQVLLSGAPIQASLPTA